MEEVNLMFMFLPFWFVFTLPGRFQLWKDYYFPTTRVNAISSARQLHSAGVMAVYCFRFWSLWGTLFLTFPGLLLLSVAYLAGPYGLMQPQVPVPMANIYWLLHHSTMARVSLSIDYHLFLWSCNLITYVFVWLETPHS